MALWPRMWKMRIISTLGTPLSPYNQAEKREEGVHYCPVLPQAIQQNSSGKWIYTGISLCADFWLWEAVLCTVSLSVVSLSLPMDANFTLLPNCDQQKCIQNHQMTLEGRGHRAPSVENHMTTQEQADWTWNSSNTSFLLHPAGTQRLLQGLSRNLKG